MRWVVAAFVALGLVLWAWHAEHQAEMNAREFCAGISLGTPLDEVALLAQGTGDDRLRRIGPDAVTVGFIGIPPFSRHVCDVRGEEGVVVQRQYVHID